MEVQDAQSYSVDDLRKMLHKNYVDDTKHVVQTTSIIHSFDGDETPYIVFVYVRRPLEKYFLTVSSFLDTFTPVNG